MGFDPDMHEGLSPGPPHLTMGEAVDTSVLHSPSTAQWGSTRSGISAERGLGNRVLAHQFPEWNRSVRNLAR